MIPTKPRRVENSIALLSRRRRRPLALRPRGPRRVPPPVVIDARRYRMACEALLRLTEAADLVETDEGHAAWWGARAAAAECERALRASLADHGLSGAVVDGRLYLANPPAVWEAGDCAVGLDVAVAGLGKVAGL